MVCDKRGTRQPSRLTPAGPVSSCQMAGPWECAMCDLAATAASPAIRLSQAPPVAGAGAVTRDRVAAARVQKTFESSILKNKQQW